MKRTLQTMLLLLSSHLVAFGINVNHEELLFKSLNFREGSDNIRVVSDICQDREGFIWMATYMGAYRYDGVNLKRYNHSSTDSNTLSSSQVISFASSPFDNSLWAGTNSGVCRYDGTKDRFKRITATGDHHNIMGSYRIRKLYFSKINTLWIGTLEGLAEYNPLSNTLREYIIDQENIINNEVLDIVEDKWGNIWLGTYDGLYRLTIKDRRLERVLFEKHFKGDPNNMLINSLLFDDQNKDILYIGTHGGMYVFDISSGETKQIFRGELTSPQVKSLEHYDSDNLLIGTERGVNLYNKTEGSFKKYTSNISKLNSIECDFFTNSYKDQSGIIWLSTKEGAMTVDTNRKNIDEVSITYDYGGETRIAQIDAAAKCSDGKLWLSSTCGVFRYDEQSGVHKHYTPKNSSLAHEISRAIYEAKNGVIWVGTNNGLQYFQDGDFRNAVPPASMDINIKYVYRIIEGPNGEIITNHNRGLCIITPTMVGDRVVSLKFDNIPFSEVIGLSNLDLTCFAVDHDGDIWIAMRKDLYSYNPREGVFTRHYHPEILTNTIDMLYVDSKNNLILSTNKGIYNIKSGVKYENVNIPEQINAFTEDNYGNLWLAGNNMIIKLKGDDSDNTFLYRTSMINRFSTAYCSRNGQLYVCGTNGFITFNPADITQDTNDKHAVISSLEMHGEEVLPGRKYNNRQILKESITNSEKIILSHSNNSIKINFSLLDFSAPLSNKYAYILDGYDRQWTTVSGLNNYASYSQLPAGKYCFKLRGANSDDVWEAGVTELEIVVRSPWWSCTVAVIIYLLIVLGVVALMISNIYTRSKLARNLYLSTIEQQKASEIDKIKQKLFTNITHDLRTPLTLILTPLEQLIQNTADPRAKTAMMVMEQNGLSLLRLINQILNLKEIDSNLISLRMIEGNIISFAEMVWGLFSEQAAVKQLEYTFESNVKQFNTQFDRDKIEKVLNNILSNAFKFTNQGSISLKVNVGDNQGGKALVQFILKDSGVGIAQQELGLIFERFYKGDNNKQINAPGSGIGLELVKEFVEMHNGHIDLDSVEGLGTTVTISLSMDVLSDQPVDEADEDETQDNGRYRILIVEDNIDLCSYIASGLSKQYITFKAYSAEAGLKIISSHHIDLVITDVMLPEMSGYELCSTIKGNLLTSLTPIIILTAKVDNESRIKSYDVGADAFITKPFSTRLLSTRIEKLLQKQVDMQKQYVKAVLTDSESPANVSEEDKFLNGLIEVIEKNIDNNEMNIPELCRLFGYSHQQVYLKVKQQTGQSLIEFIKIIRMKRAAQLMRERGDLTVSEVMYEVGIENLSYFSKCFSKYFGVSPKRFKQQLLDQTSEGDACND